MQSLVNLKLEMFGDLCKCFVLLNQLCVELTWVVNHLLLFRNDYFGRKGETRVVQVVTEKILSLSKYCRHALDDIFIVDIDDYTIALLEIESHAEHTSLTRPL